MYFIYQEHIDTSDSDGQSEKINDCVVYLYSFILPCNRLPQTFLKQHVFIISQSRFWAQFNWFLCSVSPKIAI